MTAPIGLPPQPSQMLFSGKKLTKAQKREKQRQQQQASTQVKDVITVSKETKSPQTSPKNTLDTSNLFISYPLNEAKLRKNIQSYDELSLNKKTVIPVQGIQAQLIDSDDLNKRISSRLEDSQKDTFTLVVNKAGQQSLTARELQQLGLPKEKTELMAKTLTELIANEPEQKKGDLLTGSLFSIAQKAKAAGKLNTGNNTSNQAGVAGVSTPAPAKSTTDADKTENTKTEKKDDEGGGILQGWKKTKLISGAALLAGGIALKMTLIGIVPGLIMAGAGAALMGWAGINWAMGGKKDGDKTDENKDKKADAPATENK